MIPILYEKDEAAFISNGIGRLRDCISCTVTEERNGIYECDFEYPTDGANYDLIQVGRIIGVTHDESEDVQPFDIVSYTKPINGIVTFHCVHISYRQSYLTATGSEINSLADAFEMLADSTPDNPFTYWTDKESTGYMGSADGIPKTVRQMLGGIEGSILDTYHGEYEWDKWTVKLWDNRGEYRDFSIRYGVNMLEYNEEYDSSDCYTACIPYWTDGENKVIGDKQTSGGSAPSGRELCVPLDVTDKFEGEPTKAEVEAMAQTVMTDTAVSIPSQSIKVSFVRIQDMGEYAQYENLLECKLCDTIKVYFPDYNAFGNFKIVKTVWNVLSDRYESMELGTLSLSLAEALGVTPSGGGGVSSGGGITESDPVFRASPANSIQSTDITNWNNKQNALVSGTNIKTINGNSILGSGDLTTPDDDTTYTFSISGNTLTITDSDGNTQTITLPSGGTDNYNDLSNKPSINNVTLSGNKSTSDLSIHDVPSGGSSGQVLSKASGTDYDVEWSTPTTGVTDVEVNGVSVVSGGVADVTVPTATSDLINDSGFRKIFVSTSDPTSADGDNGDVWLKYST